jgi:hypothetical protein
VVDLWWSRSFALFLPFLWLIRQNAESGFGVRAGKATLYGVKADHYMGPAAGFCQMNY